MCQSEIYGGKLVSSGGGQKKPEFSEENHYGQKGAEGRWKGCGEKVGEPTCVSSQPQEGLPLGPP